MTRRTVAALGAVVLLAGADRGADLIVIEHAPRNQQRLVRLRFRDGRLAGRDDVMTADQRFFGSFGGHHLTPDGRHLVTRFGGVVRLADGAILSREQDGMFLGFDGPRAIYRVGYVLGEKGVFAFDLATNKVAKLDPPGGWGLPGVRSPGNTKSVVNDNGPALDLLTLDLAAPGGRKSTPLGADFHVAQKFKASHKAEVPVLWLDDDRFVTQVGNGQLVVVKTDGTRTPVIRVPGDADATFGAHLLRDTDGAVIYGCGESVVRVDPAAGRWVRYDWVRLGNGFEVADTATNGRYTVRLEGKEIGRVRGYPWSGKTAPGLLAVVAKADESVISDPDEVRVWTATSGAWTRVEMQPHAKLQPTTLVGWLP